MHGIIEVSDMLGLDYQYVTIIMKENSIYITRQHVFYQAKPLCIPLNQLENIQFSIKQNRHTLSFTFSETHYFIIENASLSILALAEFIHCASFAYYQKYVSLPLEFQH
ncbi:hypothetical protein ACWOFR_02640 [Carnobacterium gallinarum]|uniref:hypothetical protein n=1 Tax=Carnobacterium gallinarum TaxID=2749 RepID=UPI00054F7CC0|nr:hypothetical protein [Carnobacterium gallinarum]